MSFINRKWMFNPTINIISAGASLPAENPAGLFKSNKIIYKIIKIIDSSLYYTNMSDVDVLVYTNAKGWVETEYRTILFIDEPTTSESSLTSLLNTWAAEQFISYTVPSNSLKQIADAIRNKTRNQNTYVFPYGFVSAINSIVTASDVGATETTQTAYISLGTVMVPARESKTVTVFKVDAVQPNCVYNTFKHDVGYMLGLPAGVFGRVQNISLVGTQLVVNVYLSNANPDNVYITSASVVIGYSYYFY